LVFVENGKGQLRISGSNDVLSLIAENQAAPDANAMNGKSVVVQGTIPEAAKNKLPGAICYHSNRGGAKMNTVGRSPRVVGGPQLLFISARTARIHSHANQSTSPVPTNNVDF
jgi:hypothetical protein